MNPFDPTGASSVSDASGASDAPLDPSDADADHPRAALLQAVLGMLVHGNEPGGLGGSGGLGGLAGLLQRFQGTGLGATIDSWLGDGANLPISAGDVRSALGDGPLRTLAEHAGVDENEAATHLSTMLPDLVDRLTPNGRLPAPDAGAGGVGELVDTLGHLFGGKAG